MVAHGGTSVAGSFIQTLTMVDIATGWTECLPLLTRQSSLVVEAIKARGLQSAHPRNAPVTATTFAKTLGKRVTTGEPRAKHRRTRRPYRTRVRMQSKLGRILLLSRAGSRSSRH